MTLKDLFLLDPEIIFLNHGSFGACPRPVFEAYQAWQRRFELQPVKFMRELQELDLEARRALGIFLGVRPPDLAFITNATHGVNIVARSLHLDKGDEILTTDHEYGACNNAWNYVCSKTGAVYIQRPIRLPATTPEEMVEEFFRGVTRRTRLIYFSHITSPTALRLPAEEICRLARQAGILTCIDGAHAPGQIPLNLETLGADFYTGNCHKWMMAPKGAGFLHARPEAQHWLEPLVVSRPYYSDGNIPNGDTAMVAYFQYTGTRDPAAFLAVPAAIQFMEQHNWDAVRRECHALLRQAIERICDLFQQPSPYPPDSGFYVQMGIAPLPAVPDLPGLARRLYDDFRVEVPLVAWGGHQFARISVQGYNTQDDIDALVEALQVCLAKG